MEKVLGNEVVCHCKTSQYFFRTLKLSAVPSCPLSCPHDPTAMDEQHQLVGVGEGILAQEEEGDRLRTFEVVLFSGQTKDLLLY